MKDVNEHEKVIKENHKPQKGDVENETFLKDRRGRNRFAPGKLGGKTRSQVTGDPIKHNFSYADLNQDHKDACEEIIRLLKHYNEKKWQIPQIIEELKSKFELIEYETIDIEKTLFHRLLGSRYPLGQVIQGYRISGNKKIPHVSLSADVDYLDEIVLDLANDIKEELIESQMNMEKFKEKGFKGNKKEEK